MRNLLIAVGVVCVLGAGGAILWLTPQHASAQAADQPTLQGFSIDEIRFDESVGGKRVAPAIPKDWKFIAVSNGEKMNCNNLWFQDGAGNIYMLQGFTSYGKFIVAPKIQKLAVK